MISGADWLPLVHFADSLSGYVCRSGARYIGPAGNGLQPLELNFSCKIYQDPRAKKNWGQIYWTFRKWFGPFLHPLD